MTTDPKPMAEEERAAAEYAEKHAVRTDGGGWKEEYDFEEQYRAFLAGVEYARPKWISVKERLPKENRLVLVCASSIEPTYGWLCGCGCGKWAINDEPNYSRQKIDHVSFVEFWMPLPREPKEANE